eukprot:SAG11_NODE_208_length_12354_cov_19.490167_1_plen_154_part_00
MTPRRVDTPPPRRWPSQRWGATRTTVTALVTTGWSVVVATELPPDLKNVSQSAWTELGSLSHALCMSLAYELLAAGAVAKVLCSAVEAGGGVGVARALWPAERSPLTRMGTAKATPGRTDRLVAAEPVDLMKGLLIRFGKFPIRVGKSVHAGL